MYIATHQSFGLEKALWSVFVEGCLHGGAFLASLTGMLLIIRWFNGNLLRWKSTPDSASAKPTQFSIRHLFVATLFVALFLGLARTYRLPWPQRLYDIREWNLRLLLIL